MDIPINNKASERLLNMVVVEIYRFLFGKFVVGDKDRIKKFKLENSITKPKKTNIHVCEDTMKKDDNWTSNKEMNAMKLFSEFRFASTIEKKIITTDDRTTTL
jgi:hypothetical protein